MNIYCLVLPHWLQCLYAGSYAGLATCCKALAVSADLRLMSLPPISVCSFSNFCIHYVAEKFNALAHSVQRHKYEILKGFKCLPS